MNHDIVALGDVCEFLDNQRVPITESDRKPGPYPYYGANGQQDSIDNYIFDEPLVLLAEDGGYFGSKDRPIAYKVTGKCWVNNHAHVLRPKSNIDVDYLHRVLSYYDVTKYVNGTTRQKLTKGNAENISFPLPPLTEQKRIASLLARADRLRQLRRTAHDLGDALLQSVFLEMFGHVRVNDKKWELARFEDVCETRLGKMLDDKKQTGKHKRPYLRNFNVRWHSLDLSDIAEMDFDEKDRKEFRLQYGDVLICEGGEVGRAAIWRNEMEECYFQKALHRARPNSKLANPEYIVHLLWWMAQTGGLVDSTSQVTFAHLTGEKLKELVIPVPPLSLQEEFAGVVARVESLRGRMGESTRGVEGLFESLLAGAFS